MTHLRSIPPRACVMISSILRSVYCSTPSMLSGEMSSFFSSSIICPPQLAASASVYNKSLIDWFIELTITWLIVFAVLRPFDDILHSIININFTNIMHNFVFFFLLKSDLINTFWNAMPHESLCDFLNKIFSAFCRLTLLKVLFQNTINGTSIYMFNVLWVYYFHFHLFFLINGFILQVLV